MFYSELEVELGQLKVDDCLNFFITKVNENKEGTIRFTP